MANVWQKAFQRIFWKNRPYTDTPLGESKLLPMDASIDTIDDRVVTLQSTKAEQSDFLTALKNIQYNPSTGVFTITKFNDSSFTIDTDIEKIAINFDYDDDPTSAHYQQLIITLDDGTVKYVDLSALITEYEFGNTSTINFTVSGSTGIVTANIINGSITSDHLAPSVTAAINAAVNSAEAHAEDSEAWARGTKDGTPVPSTADQYQNNSKYYSELSEDSAEDSEAYAKGTRNGTAVSSDDPAYHNNAKYWSDQAVATLNNKVDKEAGKGLSSNDFTNALKDKLDGIATGAEVNVQSDWSQSDNTADDFIKNKPLNLSDFSNDTNFITNTVNNLTNYYLKSETYTQAEVNALVAGISGLNYLVVQTLPTQDISTTTIYLVPKATALTDDVYDEYLYINNAWECIGSTTVDLSNYYTKSQTDTLLNAKVSDNPTFTEASTRANIASGESFATILGKIKKWFTDLPSMFVSKTGDTMTGHFTIDYGNGTTSSIGNSNISVGNNKAAGTDGATRGFVNIYGTSTHFVSLCAGSITSDRYIDLPNKGGTLALTSDITDVGTSAKFINLYVSGTSSAIATVVQEVLNAITTDNKVCIVNAIHQYAGIRYLNGYVYDDKSYGSFMLQSYSHTYKCNIKNGIITYSEII